VGRRRTGNLRVTVSAQLLTILQLCLLALLYLFFFRVLRAVWFELRPPKLVEVTPRSSAVAAGGRAARKARKHQRAQPVEPRLVVVEPLDQRGRAFPVGVEMTIGRAAGCQVTLDDTYASQLHARVFQRDGKFLVEDLGSTNGTYLNRHKVAGAMVLHAGDKVQIGNTVLELA
jgi:pSer/pThr/pTyr-binding forkhead associated (FHA) protein